jgi:hypothetical protein
MATTMTCPHCGDRWRPANQPERATHVCPNCRAVPAFGAFVASIRSTQRRHFPAVVWSAAALAMFAALAVTTGVFALATSSDSLAASQRAVSDVAVRPAPEPEEPAAAAVTDPPAPAVTPALAAGRPPDRSEAGEPQTGVDWIALLGPELEALAAKSAEPAPAPMVEPIVAVPAPARPSPPAGTCGTAIDFVSNLAEATDRAKKEHRLLFVLHVSGNFEEPGFT